MSISTMIYHIQAAMGTVPEHHGRKICKFHPHNRLSDGQGLDPGFHFGDHHRLVLFLGLALDILAGQDVLLSRKSFRLVGSLMVVIAQTALVAAQALGQMFGRLVERAVRVAGGAMAVYKYALADMDHHVDMEGGSLLGEGHLCVLRTFEILADDGGKIFLDMTTPCLAYVKLLAFDGNFHV
jgi:hypothetical protein